MFTPFCMVFPILNTNHTDIYYTYIHNTIHIYQPHIHVLYYTSYTLYTIYRWRYSVAIIHPNKAAAVTAVVAVVYLYYTL